MTPEPGLTGAVIGFIVAFVADPIKNLIRECLDIRWLRQALYGAAVETYDRAYCYLVPELRLAYFSRLDATHIKTISDIVELFVQNDKQIFDYARGQKPFLFYRLKEAPNLSSVYAEQEYYRRIERDHEFEPSLTDRKIREYAEQIKSSYEQLFASGKFDKVMIKRLAKTLKCGEHLKKHLTTKRSRQRYFL
jgi:hypothetical protein